MFPRRLFLVLYDSMIGILGMIACWGCLHVGCCKLKNEVSILSITGKRNGEVSAPADRIDLSGGGH